LEKYLPFKRSDSNKLPAGGVYTPSNLNLYCYVYNNPVKLIDPDGNRPLNSQEKEFYMNIFGSAPKEMELTVTKVPFLREHSIAPKYSFAGRGRTPGNVIMRTDSPMNDDESRIIFAHELAHQWDYDNDSGAWNAVKREFFMDSDVVYEYNKNDFIAGNIKIESLADIKFHEARAEFIADFYKAYDKFKKYEGLSTSNDPKYSNYKKQYKEFADTYLNLSKKYADVLLKSGVDGEFVKEVKRK